MPTTDIALTLDLKGLACPIPIARTAQAVRGLPPGARVEVLATDPGSVPDFKAWCQATGNRLVESSAEAGTYRYLIEKKEA